MSTVNPILYPKTLFTILRGIIDLTDLDKSKKEELTKNISASFMQKYNERISKLPGKSAASMNLVALEELENIVKEMVVVTNKTLNNEAKKIFNEKVKILLDQALIV